MIDDAPGEIGHETGADFDESWLVRNLLDGSDEVIYFKDIDSRFVRVSAGLAALHGYSQEAMVGLTDHDIYDVAHADQARADELRVIETGSPILDLEEHEGSRGGSDRWVATSKFPLRRPDGLVVGTFGISRDITRRVLAERERRQVEMQLRTVLESSTDQIAMYDAGLRYTYLNPAAAVALGADPNDLLGRTDQECGLRGSALTRWQAALQRVIERGEPWELEFETAVGSTQSWFQTRFGPHRDDQGVTAGVLAATRDITAIKAAEQAQAHQATHDPLTGLANRSLLMAHLERALARASRHDGYLAVYFVDIDRFKDTNDSFGHAVGDLVLQEVARRLTSLSRSEDVVARLAGDEMVVICEGMVQEEDIRQLADRIVAALADPFDDGLRTVPMSASVGVAVTTDSRTSARDLLARADAAMYGAKQGGRSGFRINHADTDLLPDALELTTALDGGEFSLVYQPMRDLSDQRLIGFEALLRWNHPARGMLSPDLFLPAAERTGVIRQLGAWVLETACRDLAGWDTHRQDRELIVSVNVATAQLASSDFPGLVENTLQRFGLAPRRLRLEIAEQTLVADIGVVGPILQALSRLGVELAVDNFGATVASLARLPGLPVRVVKLDRFANVDRHREVVAAVVATAHALGMAIVASGIEDQKQLAHLSTMAFDGGQGYLLGMPMPPAIVPMLLTGGL